MLVDVEDRAPWQTERLEENLVKEFEIFRDLNQETAKEDEVVKKIIKNHLSMVRTFE